MVSASYPDNYHPYPSIDDEVEDLYDDCDLRKNVEKRDMAIFEERESKVSGEHSTCSKCVRDMFTWTCYMDMA